MDGGVGGLHDSGEDGSTRRLVIDHDSHARALMFGQHAVLRQPEAMDNDSVRRFVHGVGEN